MACDRCELRFELARIVGIMIYEFHLVGYNSVALVNSCLFVQFFSCLKKSFYLIKWHRKGKFTCRPHGWFVETCSLPLNISSSYLGQPETVWNVHFAFDRSFFAFDRSITLNVDHALGGCFASQPGSVTKLKVGSANLFLWFVLFLHIFD